MSAALSIYPVTDLERDKWILAHRPDRRLLDPWRPYAYSIEDECAATGQVVRVATVFLTNRECPWRCLMCDLWRNTLTGDTPAGAIPAQIDHALTALPPARHIKLYNSGSFFDRRAIPAGDYKAIAARINNFERVIVECHPALVGESCIRFRDLMTARLEVAMGLEIAHPEILAQLNKRMTLDEFAATAAWLRQNEVDIRVFVLVKPPFLTDEAEALFWAERSVDFAFDCGASVVSLIPTRPGNGALEKLAAHGAFAPPRLSTVEEALAYGIELKRGRVFADLWDLGQQRTCAACHESRVSRLHEMNLLQRVLPPIACRHSGERG
jgi:archaeosine synthase beta-subunit